MNRYRTTAGLFGAWALLASAPAVLATDSAQVFLSVEVFRVRGNVSGTTSLTDDIWAGLDTPNRSAKQGAFIFFTRASLDLGGTKLETDEKGWRWNGAKRPRSKTPFPGVETLATPFVLASFGERFELEIVASQPIEYFARRGDGLYELKSVDRRPGVYLSGAAERGPNGRIVLRNLGLLLRAVSKREPIEGVSLNVGKPVFSEEQLSTTMSLQPGRAYGIQYLTRTGGVLFLRVVTEVVDADTRIPIPSDVEDRRASEKDTETPTKVPDRARRASSNPSPGAGAGEKNSEPPR